jgi:RHS repeat-associated protein
MFDKGKTMVSTVSILLVLMLTIGANPAYIDTPSSAVHPESTAGRINKNAKPRIGPKKIFSGITGKNNPVNAGIIYKNKNKKSNSHRGSCYGYNKTHMKTYEMRGHNNNAGDVYTYDDVYRLTNVKINAPDPTVPNPTEFEKEKTFNFDKLDNILSIVETQNEQTVTKTTQINSILNQYENFAGWGLSYDLNGNTTQKGTQHFTYNYKNQIIKAQDQTTEANYKYDALGRRVQKAVTVGSATKTTNYYYSGNHVIEERDGSDNVLNHYIYGNGIDEIIRMDSYSGATATSYYFHTNGIGSVTAITDTNGDLVERVSYDIFGMPTFTDVAGEIVSKSTIGNTLLFHGRRYDAETNLYYFRARYYDPIMGRFLQTDPMGYEDSMNLYQGFNMNPINFVDPLGRWYIGEHANITNSVTQDEEYENIRKIIYNYKKNNIYIAHNSLNEGLERGSIWPDLPKGLVNLIWNVAIVENKDSLSYQSHKGRLQHLHFMFEKKSHPKTPRLYREMVIRTVVGYIMKARMLLFGKEYQKNDWGIGKTRVDYSRMAGLYIGIALHIIQDSYAPSHAARNENMEIIRIQDYSEQDPTLHQELGDFSYHFGQNNIRFFNAAKEATRKVLGMVFSQNFDIEKFKQMLREEIFKFRYTDGKIDVKMGGTLRKFVEQEK